MKTLAWFVVSLLATAAFAQAPAPPPSASPPAKIESMGWEEKDGATRTEVLKFRRRPL